MSGIDYGLAESIVKKFATTGFKSMTKKSEDKANGTVTYTLVFSTTSGNVSQDLTFNTGTDGKDGTNITSSSFVGNDLVFTLSDASTVVLTNAKVTLKGDKGDNATASPDSKSLDTNSSSQLELLGFTGANNDTVVIRQGGTVVYLPLKPSSSNSYTQIASKEYVDEVATGSLMNQDGYNATTNTPDITAITVPTGKAYYWIVTTAGTQILNSTSYTFAVNDWVIKNSSGKYIKIANSTVAAAWGNISGALSAQTDLYSALTSASKTAVWGGITGNITDQADLATALNGKVDKVTGKGLSTNDYTDSEKAIVASTSGTNTGDETNSTIKTKLGSASISSDGYLTSTDWNTFNDKADINDAGATGNTTETYSINKIISLLADKQGKIVISATQPAIASNTLWISTSPYKLYYCDGTAYNPVGGDNQISIGTTAPTDTSKLWLDTTSTTSPLLKWYNATSWISISGTGTGGSNTFSNQGTGVGVYSQTVGSDVQFRSIKAGTNMTASQSGNEIVLSANITGNANATIDYSTANSNLFTYDSAKIDFDTTNVKLKGNDVIDANTKYLYHLDDSNFSDSMGHGNITNAGATFSSTVKKFGAGSMALDGVSQTASIPYSTDWNFPSGDFTIECDVYPYASGSSSTGTAIFQAGVHSGGNVFFECLVNSTNNVSMNLYNGSAYVAQLTSTATLTLNTWNHVAVSRGGNTIYLSVNGAVVSVAYTGTTVWPTNKPLYFGRYDNGSTTYYYKINIDEVRISSTCRYSANFTPATYAYGTNFDTTGYNTVSLKPAQLFDASKYYQVNGITITQNAPTNTNILYGLDVGGTYQKYWNGTAWADITTPSTQGMTATAMSTALTNYAWNSLSSKFGLVAYLYSSDVSTTPTIDNIAINYLASPNILAGHVVQDASGNKTQRANMKFTGTGVTATDDSINNATIIDITNATGQGSKVSLANQTANVTLTAPSTVDVCEYLGIAQTTTGITITLPTPTVTANARRLFVANTGSASFTMNGVTIGASNFAIFTWSPTLSAWTTQPQNNVTSTALAYGYYGISDSTSTQSLTAGTWTRASGTATALTANNITNTNGYFRFTITQAGSYQISSSATILASAVSWVQSAIYKNGSVLITGSKIYNGGAGMAEASCSGYIGTFAVGDYIDLYVYSANTGTFNGGYLTVTQEPVATYVPASATTVTEWTSYTPTLTCPSTTFTLVNTYAMKGLYRIVGKNMQLKFIYSHTSNTGFNEGSGSTPYQISIPSGYTIDTTKANIPSLLTSTTGNGAGIDSLPLGTSTFYSGTAPVIFTGKVVPLSTTTLGIHHICMNGTMTPFTLWGCGNSYYGGSTVELTFEANIPIL